MTKDEKYLKLALEEAGKGLGLTFPNPSVGAVIVKNGVIVSTGYHERAGHPHAEAIALEKAGEKARGATLYCSLEPCNHFGKTPPCTEAIISAGIKRVVYGFGDPNTGVKGRGAGRLKKAGIEVSTGFLDEEFNRFYRPWAKFITKGLPYLTLKSALTLDGRVGTSTGDSKWISNEKSRLLVQKARSESDAILTGIGTVKADDPHLNVRIKTSPQKNPVRIILDSNLSIDEQSFIVQSARLHPTFIAATEKADKKKAERLVKAGAEIGFFPLYDEKISLNVLFGYLGARRGITNILVEAGPTLSGELIRGGFVDELWLIFAPKLTAGNDGIPLFAGKGISTISESKNLEIFSVNRVSGDIHICAYLKE